MDSVAKYDTRGLDGDTDHASVDDTVRTCEFRGSAMKSSTRTWSMTRLVSCFAPSQAHFSARQADTRAPPASTALAPLAKAVHV